LYRTLTIKRSSKSDADFLHALTCKSRILLWFQFYINHFLEFLKNVYITRDLKIEQICLVLVKGFVHTQVWLLHVQIMTFVTFLIRYFWNVVFILSIWTRIDLWIWIQRTNLKIVSVYAIIFYLNVNNIGLYYILLYFIFPRILMIIWTNYGLYNIHKSKFSLPKNLDLFRIFVTCMKR